MMWEILCLKAAGAIQNGSARHSRFLFVMEAPAGSCPPEAGCKPSLQFLEAPAGFEPANNGFANRCLNHLAMAPRKELLI